MSVLRLLCVSVALVLLVVLAGCGGGGGGVTPPPILRTGQVEGVVYVSAEQLLSVASRGANRVLTGAIVRVQGTNISDTSDSNGHFYLENVPVGAQTLIISCDGYQSLSLPVTVAAGTTITVTDKTLTPAPRKWTVLVFMNADNDLEEYGVQDVNEMESVPNSDQVAVLVQMDRSGDFDTTNGNWTDARRFLVQHDDDPQIMTSAESSPVLEQLGEVDMGQPSALREFIAWGKAQCPAEHYLVVIWNHGSGWRSRSVETAVTRGVSFDDTSGTYIRTVDLPAALQSPTPLDMVSFDSSLMQMLEIAYEMRHSCDYIVGSEESPPGAGYPYQTWLSDLGAQPAMTPAELGEDMARRTRDYYGISSNITHSVIDTAELSGLASALDTFATALIPVASSQATKLAEARNQAESFAYPTYIDLYHYAALVKAKISNTQVRAAADGVMAAVNSAIIAEYHGDYHPNAHGVSIYIPMPYEYVRNSSQYIPLALAKDTHWNEWLGAQKE